MDEEWWCGFVEVWAKEGAQREEGVWGAGLKNAAVFGRTLQSLVLWNCLRLTEEGLEVLRCLPHVTSLSLRACQQLSDSAMPALASLSSLLRLDLRACERFTGTSSLASPSCPAPPLSAPLRCTFSATPLQQAIPLVHIRVGWPCRRRW